MASFLHRSRYNLGPGFVVRVKIWLKLQYTVSAYAITRGPDLGLGLKYNPLRGEGEGERVLGGWGV